MSNCYHILDGFGHGYGFGCLCCLSLEVSSAEARPEVLKAQTEVADLRCQLEALMTGVDVNGKVPTKVLESHLQLENVKNTYCKTS